MSSISFRRLLGLAWLAMVALLAALPARADEPPATGPSIDELLGPIGEPAGEVPANPEIPPGPSVAELLGPMPGSEPEAEPEAEGVPSCWFWTLTGLAAAAGIGGGIAGGLVLGAEDEYDTALAACRAGSGRACADGPRIVSDFEDYRLATNILLFSAGGFALAAFVLAFFTEFALPPPMDDTPLAPLLGLRSGGATLSWRF
ncbi:MAG: hypothetical protein HY905_22455 [Deltaproteobacteria bacterium]|nr:hypothetical protein [Deltaproteobacteria bacterium]